MSISLNGLKPKDTYQALIKVGDNTSLDGTNKVLSDGLGNDLPVEVSASEINFTGLVKQGGVQIPTESQVNAKVSSNTAIVGATKTKVTYDSKGLVTSGDDATTLDIADALNKRYVSDSQLIVLGNTSGTNTGDNATNTQYSGLALSKQDTLVSGTNIKTINSTSLLGSGDIVIAASPSGVSGAIQFSNGSAFSSDAINLFYDDTNNRLGVGINVPTATIHSKGSGNTAATKSFRAENLAGTRSFEFFDSGQLVFNNSATQRMTVVGYESAITFQSTSGNIITENGIQSQAGGGQIVDGILHLAIAGNSHLFRKNIQLDGTISPNTVFQTSFNDGGGTFSNTYRMVNITPTLTLSGAGAKNFIGLTFNPTITASANTRIFGAVFESGDVLIGGAHTSGNASASLEMISTTKGLLPPRMTTTQKNAIVTPASGLMVYDTTTNKLCCYNGTIWNDLF